MRKKKPEDKVDTGRYMLTYSDMITLLMMFFIVMYASSSVNAKKFQQLSQSFKVALDGGSGQSIIGNQDAVSMKDSSQYVQQQNTTTSQNKGSSQSNASQTAQALEQNTLAQLKKTIDNYIAQNNMSGSVSTSIQERGLVVSVQEASFFDSGQADIKPQFANRIVQIGNILNSINNYLRIEGNTDNVPIKNSKYQDNLDLSTERAENVARILINGSHVNPSRIGATGYGEYRPVASNDTEAGRAKNRRVDIVVVDNKFNGSESNAGK
ncbi:MAG: flagellar motor protein MotB [Clostridium sp.]|nr:flagellar motor protein MotB [Clostridium sp.]